MNGKQFRPQTGATYENSEALADAVKKESVYAESLGKTVMELTQEERLAAVNYKPVEVEKPETKKTKSSTSKSGDNKSETTKDGEEK